MSGASLIVEMDRVELACRIAESMMKAPRPEGWSASRAMNAHDLEMRERLMNAALAAMTYLKECTERAQVPS